MFFALQSYQFITTFKHEHAIKVNTYTNWVSTKLHFFPKTLKYWVDVQIIDEVLSINPSANVFVFGDFNVHHRDWLTYSGGTSRSGELCYNCSISYDLNFPTHIPDCDSHRSALLDLFISSGASICSAMAFPLFGNFDHVVSIDFPSYSQRDAPFHHIAYDYSCADWKGLCDHLRDVQWEDIFKLSASAAASEFCEWVQVGIDVYISHGQTSIISVFFSCLCCCHSS